jgi:alpha-amylase
VPEICIYAQVHQPYRLRQFRLFDIGSGCGYFDDETNRRILRRVAEKCYLPANRTLADLIRASDGGFRVALSLSGALLDQMAEWAPDVLESFQMLVDTGGVELLGETHYHSLASLASEEEFVAQVERHRRAIARWFGQRPTVFRNTELIYWDGLAPAIERLGFEGVMVEGADHVMGWRSSNYVYHATTAPGLRLLPRNYRLSDDVGFRFSNRGWDGWPLTAEKYADWVASSGGDSAHLFVDYETFGEHQWADTGIFDFLRHLPEQCRRRGLTFTHPSCLASRPPVAPLSFPRPTSWADAERDTTAWLGNRLQESAQQRLYGLREAVLASGDPVRIEEWRRLTTSDHLYYMCTKWFTDGDVHKYFSPYDSPYDAFVAFMNVAQDLEQGVEERLDRVA